MNFLLFLDTSLEQFILRYVSNKGVSKATTNQFKNVIYLLAGNEGSQIRSKIEYCFSHWP